MSNIDPALAYARKNREQAVEDLRQLIRIPSISMTPEHQPDVLRGAEWLSQRLQSLGVEDVQILPTAGHPVVYGHWRGAGKAPTILVYGHYDVQPVDPLDLWKSDPFEAEQRGENLYGRGASDMKGQLIAFLQAFEAVRQAGRSAVNLKFLIEGGEEAAAPAPPRPPPRASPPPPCPPPTAARLCPASPPTACRFRPMNSRNSRGCL